MELVPELRGFVPPASVIDRMVYSAFGGGRLLGFLSKHHVDTLIISGGETDVCVLSTVLSAVDLGYRIILVEGALCSPSDESHAAILGLYRQRFDIQASVADVEHILGLWKPA
jgi:nicotinamidase-related amidase